MDYALELDEPDCPEMLNITELPLLS